MEEGDCDLLVLSDITNCYLSAEIPQAASSSLTRTSPHSHDLIPESIYQVSKGALHIGEKL